MRKHRIIVAPISGDTCRKQWFFIIKTRDRTKIIRQDESNTPINSGLVLAE